MEVLAIWLLAVVFNRTSSFVRYKSGEGELGCFSGPTVNCERAVTSKAEFECHVEWKITHVN